MSDAEKAKVAQRDQGYPHVGREPHDQRVLAWIHRSIANSVESLQASRPSEAGWRFT
jgi:hypothetical protein